MPFTYRQGGPRSEKGAGGHIIYLYLDAPNIGVASMELINGVKGTHAKGMACIADCKLLSVTGVLTLDEEERLIYFCDQCDLHP